MTLKYLLDENVEPLYQIQLKRQEPTIVVWRVGTPGGSKSVLYLTNKLWLFGNR